ncbi:MAG TPA: M28 family peptidase, partial [Puia sp.]|nr:M28 family peptidase [Puia sp.]
MTPVKMIATWLFLGVLLVSCICLHIDFKPAAVNGHPADTSFSVRRAYAHLGRIAAVPHSLGTAANDSVGAYLDSVGRQVGLEVSRLPFTSIKPFSKGIVIGRGVNIAATLKGTGGGKKILVMGHYDSEPNALGAGDDGSACAAMLETARALRSGQPLNRDVVFLFTNGEEDGLLGASAFVRDSTNLKDIGLVLNFDGRGNAGNCIMFRASPNSHWLIDGYAHAPIHHVTGSFYNELFNWLPNNTDLTPFLRAHLPGLDFAYVEG